MLELFAPFLYKPIFLHFALLLSMVYATQPMQSGQVLVRRRVNNMPLLLTAAVLILVLGLRPIHWAFGDTINYARAYRLGMFPDESSSEWFFYGTMKSFYTAGLDVSWFFLFAECFYIGGYAWICKKLCPNHAMSLFTVCLASFSFFSYATNGIRNGMACGIWLIALGFYFKRKVAIAFILAFLATRVHTSLLLPTAAAILSYYYPKTKHYLYVWLVCLAIGMVASGVTEVIFQNIGLVSGDRGMEYLSNDAADLDQFSRSGFRWDFALYGCVPILMGAYMVFRKKYVDKTYVWLLNIYIICNSFWALLNRSWLSNRIAFLSWFLFAFVLMYPLFNAPYLHKRKKWVAYTIMGNVMFSYVMWIIGKYM